jgi:hypothetical protein
MGCLLAARKCWSDSPIFQAIYLSCYLDVLLSIFAENIEYGGTIEQKYYEKSEAELAYGTAPDH